MNYTLNSLRIKSNWFDDNGKILKIGVDGFNLYLTLFRFRLHNQEEEYTFITSLSLLRKELDKSYTTNKIIELLKRLKKLKVIEIENLSRWDQLIVNGKVDDNRVLVIKATDRPNTVKKNGVDTPVSDDDFYIVIDLQLMNHYQSLGLDAKYYLFYALCRKYQKGSQDFNMSIQKIEERIGIDKNIINRMIWTLHEHYLLLSRKEKRNSTRFNFHHFICENFDGIDKFIKANKETIDIEINKRNKKKNKKSLSKQKSQVNNVKPSESNELAFGKKGSSTIKPTNEEILDELINLDELIEDDKSSWGNSNPFKNNNQSENKTDQKKYEKINDVVLQVRINPFTDEKEYLFEGEWLSKVDVDVATLML